MKEFLAERKLAHDEDTLRELYLSEWLLWAQGRQRLTMTTSNEGDE